MLMERRRKKRTRSFEVTDVELAWVFYSGPSEKDAMDFKTVIENQGHRAIMREIEI